MSALKNIESPIEKELQEFESYFKKSLQGDVPLLSTILNFLYRNKGKQLRPIFVFLSAKLHGETNEFSKLAACSVELLHTATLVHDDVVDEAYERLKELENPAIYSANRHYDVSTMLQEAHIDSGVIQQIHENVESLFNGHSEKKMLQEREEQMRRDRPQRRGGRGRDLNREGPPPPR